MDHRLKLLLAVVLTFVITLSGGFVTEYIRQSITFSWGIEVGDEFVYEVLVIGNASIPSQVLPPPLEPMNNTRIIVEINSLPNLTLYYYTTPFIQDVVDHPKTNSSFADGSPIPAEFYYAINSHASLCILPTGAWGHLDTLFPDQVNRAIIDRESFIAVTGRESFFFGYWLNETSSTTEWHGFFDLTSGVPVVSSFSVYTVGQPWIYSYTVTLTLVT